ncbi:MAG: peroxiredoxin-like family protein [Planctomycetota bacterium]
MGLVLWAAAGYNLLWGGWVVLFPSHYFDLVGMARPVHPSIWQCVGMIVGVYGLGYAIAATNPLRHWPIVLVGLLGKVFGPIGYVDGAFVRGTLDPAFGWTIPTNDLVWWVPFAMILWAAFRAAQGEEHESKPLGRAETAALLNATATQPGDETLGELSRRGPVLLMLVRHFGCTLCRRDLADLATRLDDLRQRGVTPVVAHQSEEDRGRAILDAFGLDSVRQVSDPDRRLYRGLGLPRGTFQQLFGLRSFVAAARAVRHGVGRPEGDGFQMPGTFLLRDGRVVKAHEHVHAGDRVNLCCFAEASSTPGTDAALASRKPTAASV